MIGDYFLSVVCNDFSVKYFNNAVAAVNAGLAKVSLNNTFTGASPKYSPSETRKLIITFPLAG